MGHDPVKTEIRLDTVSASAGNGLLFDNSLNYVGLRIDGLGRRVTKRVAHGEPDKKHELYEGSWLTEFNSLVASWVPKRVVST